MLEQNWQPRCALRVGVAGNRRFAGEKEQPTAEADAMRRLVTDAFNVLWPTLFTAIGTVLREPHGESRVQMRDLFSSDRPRLAVLTSLAAGADQIGARTALEAAPKHPELELQLEAILPFREESYPGTGGAPKPEFRPAEAAELRALKDKACQVVWLDGTYDDETLRVGGYVQARDLLVQNSDIVIAVYDPNAPAHKAGTVETVVAALDSGAPVVAVLVSGTETRVSVLRQTVPKDTPPASWDDASPIGDASWRDELLAIIREQLVLPELWHAAQQQTHAQEEHASHALRRLRLFSGAQDAPAICTNGFASWVLHVGWRAAQGIASAGIRRRRPRHDEPPDPEKDRISLAPYVAFYDRASELSSVFMRAYRGAFVWSYFLAGVAVAAAVAMMLLTILYEHEPPKVYVLLLCLLKIGILGLMLVIERIFNHLRLQETAADFRYVAELLRPMQWLTPVGTYPPAVDLPLHASAFDPRRSWTTWLARAIARSSPSVSAKSDNGDWDHPREIILTAGSAADALDRASSEWIGGQVIYHRDNGGRMRLLDEGFGRVERALLMLVIAAAVVACTLELSQVAHRIAAFLGALAAILPAFIAALLGIKFQSEAKRLAARSEAMHDALSEQQRQLGNAAGSIRSAAARGDGIARAATVLRKLSHDTITETGDWKVLYQIHEIHAG
jgi:hypothetical protein